MESTPSTSKAGSIISPPRKRIRLDLGHLTLSEKQCILNVYKQIVTREPEKKTTAIINEIVNTIGVAKSTVYRVVKEYKSTGLVSPSTHRGGRPAKVKNFDEVTKYSIRKIIHNFFHKNELPTLNKVLNEINKRQDLPQMSRSSLYKLMKELNFKYMKRNRNSFLIERDDIVRWRRTYLKTIKNLRKDGHPIYYMDETWISVGHTKGKVWVDTNIRTRRQAFIQGLTTGLKAPSGKGRRLIIVHVGSESGFVEGGLLLFEGKKTTDYHDEMNAKVFEEWFSNLLNKLPDKAVIVMDNAPYHSRKSERIPTTSSRKKEMQEWLLEKNISFDIEMVRSELLHIIRCHKEKYEKYIVDEMAKAQNKIVLRLPPYHCELNPIELAWAKIKNEVASKNSTFNIKDIKKLFLKAVENVSSTDWKRFISHIIKEEEKMLALDGIIDNLIEPLIICPNESSTSSSDSD